MIKLRSRPKKPGGPVQLCHHKMELHPSGEWVSEGPERWDGYFEEAPFPTLAEVVKFFTDKGIDLNEVNVSYEGFRDGNYTNSFFQYREHESKEDFDERMKQYKREAREYNDWYQENKVEIKAHKAAIKKQKDEEKAAAREVARKKSLLKQQEKITALLEEMS